MRDFWGPVPTLAFETEEEILQLQTNDLMGSINDTALYWVFPTIKTCHKCGSMKHLVIECKEKKENDEFKQKRNGYNRVTQDTEFQITKT